MTIYSKYTSIYAGKRRRLFKKKTSVQHSKLQTTITSFHKQERVLDTGRGIS